MIKDGKIRGYAPLIAGYYGLYTAHVPGSYSFSYNVRETTEHITDDVIYANMMRQLDPTYRPLENLMQDIVMEIDDFATAVDLLRSQKVTSPGYVIVGGLENNEGVVIARDPEGVAFEHWLSEEDWYVVQTNKDYVDTRH